MTTVILVGDALRVLRRLPDNSVNCVVTSPPYWGLRSYHGGAAMIGLEATLGEHLDKLVAVFREVRRVLRWDGTCFLNYGDAYACKPNGRAADIGNATGNDDRVFRDKPLDTTGPITRPSFRRDKAAVIPHRHADPHGDRAGRMGGDDRWGGGDQGAGPIYREEDSERNRSRRGRSGNLGNGGTNGAGVPLGRIEGRRGGVLKPKDRMLLPHRLAIALQEDGWWVRDEIIWHKPAPMPSSTFDRTTSAHELVYLLTKSPHYFYDHIAIQEPFADGRQGRDYPRPNGPTKSPHGQGFTRASDEAERTKDVGGWAKGDDHSTIAHNTEEARSGERNRGGRTDGFTKPNDIDPSQNGGRNRRSVWTVPSVPSTLKHFATFPPNLIAPMIKAGCPARVCLRCGAPQIRLVTRKGKAGKVRIRRTGSLGRAVEETPRQGDGFYPSCACDAGTRPGVVLDPFAGTCTTGLVADRLQRHSVMIEISPQYAKDGLERVIGDQPPLLADVTLTHTENDDDHRNPAFLTSGRRTRRRRGRPAADGDGAGAERAGSAGRGGGQHAPAAHGENEPGGIDLPV